MTVEFAGASAIGDRHFSRSSVIARAPEWWRQLADRGLRSAAAEKSSARQRVASKPAVPIAGWVFGVACCGVSEPAYADDDKRTLPEQFTPAALADMAKQAGGERVIPLTYDHRGETLAMTRGLDFMLKVDPFYGLTFNARLRDTELNRRVLADLERGVLGVSVGFQGASGWTTERRGLGAVRIIDKATLHHVALLRRDSKLLPAYRACWASGRRGDGPGCPAAVQDAAKRMAYVELVRQAKVTA